MGQCGVTGKKEVREGSALLMMRSERDGPSRRTRTGISAECGIDPVRSQ